MYNRLFGKILDSSIWLEPDSTRIVWITFLAAMDEEGYAHFSAAENLARRAGVSLSNAQKAIKTLESPDPNSHDKDNEGRRIERVDGGWVVLNAEKYRSIANREAAREWNRNRIRELRERKRKEAKENNKEAETHSYSEAESTGVYVHVSDTPVTKRYEALQTDTEKYMVRLRALGFRRSTAIDAEHALTEVLEEGANPEEVIKACARIFVWTKDGKFARDLADTIRRWKEPQHLWERKDDKTGPDLLGIAGETLRKLADSGDKSSGSD